MSRKAFLCKRVQPEDQVEVEDLGSDWEEEKVVMHNERHEFRYHPKGKRMPKIDWAREEQIEAEEGKKREIRKLRKEKWAQGLDIKEWNFL